MSNIWVDGDVSPIRCPIIPSKKKKRKNTIGLGCCKVLEEGEKLPVTKNHPHAPVYIPPPDQKDLTLKTITQ